MNTRALLEKVREILGVPEGDALAIEQAILSADLEIVSSIDDSVFEKYGARAYDRAIQMAIQEKREWPEIIYEDILDAEYLD